jgi:hypothetical protein
MLDKCDLRGYGRGRGAADIALQGADEAAVVIRPAVRRGRGLRGRQQLSSADSIGGRYSVKIATW